MSGQSMYWTPEERFGYRKHSEDLRRYECVDLNPSTKGAICEQYAAIYLMKDGYEVYVAASPHSKHDLVAVKNGTFITVQVRMMTFNKDGVVVKAVNKHNADMLLRVSLASGEVIREVDVEE